MEPATGSEVATTDRYHWRVLSVTGMGMTAAFLGMSMVPVALPTMVADLQAGPLQSDWFLLAYQLVTAMLMMPFSQVSDQLGRRRMYIAGLALISVTTLAIALVPDPSWIVGLRAVQGIGAAAVIVNTTALLADAFPPRLVSVGIGWNVTIMSASVALGPFLGGLLTQTLGWQSVFWVIVPIAGAGSFWAAHVLRTAWERPPGGVRFDTLGTLASAIALGGLVLAVNSAGASGWSDPLVLVLLGACVLSAVLFVVVETRVKAPLLDFSLVLVRFRGSAYLSTALVTVAQGGVALIVSLYLQSVIGLSAAQAGLHLTAQAAGNVACSAFAGRLATRLPTRWLASAGLSIVLLALAALALAFTFEVSGFGLVVVLFFLGLGAAFYTTPNAAAINAGVPAHRRGMANGLRVMIDNSAMMISNAVVLVLVTSSLPLALKTAAVAGDTAAFSAEQTADFATAFPMTLWILIVPAAVSLVVSLLRGPDPVLSTEVDDPALQPGPVDEIRATDRDVTAVEVRS